MKMARRCLGYFLYDTENDCLGHIGHKLLYLVQLCWVVYNSRFVLTMCTLERPLIMLWLQIRYILKRQLYSQLICSSIMKYTEQVFSFNDFYLLETFCLISLSLNYFPWYSVFFKKSGPFPASFYLFSSFQYS